MIQFIIAVLTILAVLSSQHPNIQINAYSCIFGLIVQPFWIYETWTKKQYGMFTSSVVITFSWIYGLYRFWL